MERHRADLECQARHDERQRHQHDRGLDGAVRLANRSDALTDAHEVGVAGRAVEQRAAHQGQRRSESAEQEVLERRLTRAQIAAAQADHAVHAERHRLQSHEEAEEIARRSEHHRAHRGEHQERVELAAIEIVLGQVTACEQRGQAAAEAEHEAEEEREAVDDQVRGERLHTGDRLGPDHPHGHADQRAGKEHDRATERELIGAARAGIGRYQARLGAGQRDRLAERLGEHEQQTTDGDDQDRRDSEQ